MPDGRLQSTVPTTSISLAKVTVGQTVNLGNGTVSQAFNIQQVETTVVAQDGETVVLGGLIQQSDNKTEVKIPCLGDLPYIGTLDPKVYTA